MSPRAASRLESLGFHEVHDYAAGKADWFAAGLPMEGEVAEQVFIGKLVRHDVPDGMLDDTVGDVRERAAAAGWDQAVVLDERRVLLGWLSEEALRSSEPAVEAEASCSRGPVTFRPNGTVEETASWMDRRGVDSVLVTSSDGTFLGVLDATTSTCPGRTSVARNALTTRRLDAVPGYGGLRSDHADWGTCGPGGRQHRDHPLLRAARSAARTAATALRLPRLSRRCAPGRALHQEGRERRVRSR